jgi:hypothetical protein
MAYINFKNCTKEEYENVIYSQDCRHKLRIWFNNVELEDADIYCEKLTVSSRIIPNGSKIFMLENFISKEVTLILHEVDLSVIKDQVKISIGTLVNEDYEYVPVGIFNIQDKPTTDNGKTTIKLRDNSVKFDFNYNGKDLIDNNSGSATKLQILQDICNQAGVVCNITEFLGSEDLIGIYDNTITGRTYVSYLAGQAGAIPTINRDGELIFIYINNLVVHEIPLHFVEKYSNGDLFKISRVVYESGIIKYEKGTTDNDTLFLDSSNPYVSSDKQVQSILEIVNGFEINSFSTGKIIGNPAIDSYDLISITDEGNTYKTLATNDLTYNGVIIQTFNTEIGLEARKENVSLNSDDTWKKNAKTEIDNIKAEVRITTEQVGKVEDKVGNTYTKEQTNELIQNAESGLTNIFTQSGGNNLLRNTAPWYMKSENTGEYWTGNLKQIVEPEATSGYAILTQNGTISQSVSLPTGTYSVSFKYKKLIDASEGYVRYNGKTFNLTETSGEIHSSGEITNNQFVIEINSNSNDSFEIYDLILKHGSEGLENMLVWTQNANESRSDTVQISEGITTTSSITDTKATMDSAGFIVRNKTTGTAVMEATKTGGKFLDLISTGKSNLSGLLVQKVGSKICINGESGS